MTPERMAGAMALGRYIRDSSLDGSRSGRQPVMVLALRDDPWSQVAERMSRHVHPVLALYCPERDVMDIFPT